VPASGQRWTTAAELAGAGHRSDIRWVEPGLLGVGVDPTVAIGQRGLVIQTPEGNLLWDPPGFVDEQAIAAVEEIGGLTAVTASHPHFYGSIVEWGHAFSQPILPGVTLIQRGGRFPGSAVAHWAGGADGAVQGVVEAVRSYRFDRIYGGWWQPVLRTSATAILETSARRYIDFLRGDAAVD
jgi:hypothetical protein